MGFEVEARDPDQEPIQKNFSRNTLKNVLDGLINCRFSLNLCGKFEGIFA